MNRSGGDIHRLYAGPLMASAEANAAKPRKLRRISRACDFCHRRSIRCKPSQEADRCQNCTDFDVDCTFDRPAKKRGTKCHSHTQSVENVNSTTGEHANLLLHLIKSHSGDGEDHPGEHHPREDAERGRVDVPISFPLAAEYRDMVLSNLDKIQDLVSVYSEVVYPM